MKNIKFFFWFLLSGIAVLVVFQNQDLFFEKRSLRIDLFFAEYRTPELALGLFLLACFFTGLLIAYFFNLYEKYKSARAIRKLNVTVDSQRGKLSELEREVDSLKKDALGSKPDSAVQPPEKGQAI